MAADAVVSRELKSLQDEMSVALRERSSGPAVPPPPAPAADPPKATADERELRDELSELTSEVTRFFDEAEKGISAHPTQSVVGALLVGILIGRLLGRH